MRKKIPLDKIASNARIRPRAELVQQAIDDYSAAMRDGVKFPPIVVYEINEGFYTLAHGSHRYRAALKAGLEEIDAEVMKGDLHDALLCAAGANKNQGTVGLRFTNTDKRQAVGMLLEDEKWAGKSDRWIAGIVGVSHVFVAGLRPEVVTVTTSPREGQDGKKYPAKGKGKGKKKGGSKNDSRGKTGEDVPGDAGGSGGTSTQHGESEKGADSGDSDRDSKNGRGNGEPVGGDEEESKSTGGKDRDPLRVDWGKEKEKLQKKIRQLVKEFEGYEDKLDGMLAELRDFYTHSNLGKEAKELDMEMVKVAHVGDRIRSKFMSRPDEEGER